MVYSRVVVALFLSFVLGVHAFDDVTSLMIPFCSGEPELLQKADKCAEGLPEIVSDSAAAHQLHAIKSQAKTARNACSREVTGSDSRKEFLEQLCQNTKEIALQMRLCLYKKQSEITITAADVEKVMKFVQCLRVVLYNS